METLHIIEALERIQALISADVDSPWCPIMTREKLGKAYHDFAEALAQRAREATRESVLSL